MDQIVKPKSRVGQLIAQLCPGGVEFRTLGEVGEFIHGSGLQKSDLAESGVGAIHYGQIHTHYGTWAKVTKSFVSEALAAKLRKARPGDIVIATTSEDDEAVAKAVAWVGDAPVVVSGDAYIYRHTLDPKYVAYFFQSEQFQHQKKPLITGTKVRRVSGQSLAKIRIPIPPREIQREIVDTLDNFTKLKAELEAELNAELEARRAQHEHYRAALLNVADRHQSKWATISDICEISRGRVISREYVRDNAGEYPVYSSQTVNEGIFGRIGTYDYDGEYITWTTDGANAGSVFYRNGKFSITNVCGLLKVRVKYVNTKFLTHSLAHIAKEHVSSGMGNPKLMSNVMRNIPIPIPPLAEQERVASILDRFGALMNEISAGLPAEVRARRWQYEYYRDRLLTFPEHVAA